MPVRVSPEEPNPTHHVSLRGRGGPTVGLIMCDKEGNPRWDGFRRSAIERTSLKTASGENSYADLEYPYSTVVQDDWSGGRGGLDFERDNTKFYDSMRLTTGQANKAFLGPQEQWTDGMRDLDHSVPGDVTWVKMLDSNQYLSVRFQAGASYTAALAWLLMRKRGGPEDLTIAVHNDSAGSIDTEVDSITVSESRMADILSEWLCEDISAALTSGSYYWIKVSADGDDDIADHWEIGVKASAGTTKYSSDGSSWTSASFDLYYRLTDANSTKTVIEFNYKEQKYFVVSGASGAPSIYMTGDRGAADSNSGNLDKLIDGTKSWPTNKWVGDIVLITAGDGVNETQRWRKITANNGTQLTLDEDWTIEHTTDTEYVILSEDHLTEITGHDITAPVTDVLVTSEDVVLFAQGDDTNMRRHRAFNDSGTWKDFGHADCKSDDGTNKATFLTHKPQAQKIVKGNNSDGSGDISIDTADAASWGNHTFSGSPTALSGSGRMTALGIYPDSEGNEAVWVGREDLPWIVPGSGNPYPFQIEEVKHLKASNNASFFVTGDVYLYMPVRDLLERWYNGSLDDVGPNQGEGLPADRQGEIVDAVALPGKLMVAVDAGDDGYSSVLSLDNGGYHEYYRAPKGQRITTMGFQPVEGASDRLWVCVANDVIWLPFPNTPGNELDESDYLFTHEGCLTLSRMHAGMLDVEKLTRYLNLWTEDLTEDEQWLEIDYRLDDNTDWITYDNELYDEPQATIDFGQVPTYGLGAKRIQMRVRFYTTDNTATPILLAVILETVIRIGVKHMYPLVFRLMDDEPCLSAGEHDDYKDAMDKLKVLDDMADATDNTMVMMRSVSPLYDGKMVFLNPIDVEQIKIKKDPNNDKGANVYVCTTTVQDA